MSPSKKSPDRGQSLSLLMMLAPFVLMFVILEMRLGSLKHSGHRNADGGNYFPAPLFDLSLDDDDAFDGEWIDED